MSKILIDEATVQLALKALEVATTPFARDRQEVLRAQAALRKALTEQPAPATELREQEPVAYLSEGGNFSFEPWQRSTPLYTTPPQHKPLTDEEIDELRSGYQSGRIGSFVALARAIEAAHGIKENT